jgi:alkylation response protein AidB-like acyl-CoA dehydrogenase
MDFALTEIQQELKAAARRYLSDRYPLHRIAELADGDVHDIPVWPELVRQGWLDPDLGPVEHAVLAEESGRALLPVPWWATVVTLPVYLAAGTDLPGPVTLADGRDTCTAHRDGDAWRLDGRVTGVVDAVVAAEIVVAAATPSGTAVFGIQPTRIADRSGIDPLRPCADLEFTSTSARLLVDSPAAEAVLADSVRRARALLGAEAVGVADRALELAVDYARTRVQFDRPIGSYQAVAHQLADGYAELELARSLAYRTAAVLADDPARSPEALASAEHATTRAAVRVCETAIQVCGGIGVTWEYALHRWYRRALWLQAFPTGGPDPLAVVADWLLGSADAATVSGSR